MPAPSVVRRPHAGAVRAATPRAASASRRRVDRTLLVAPGSFAPRRAPVPTFTVVRSRAARRTATSVPLATRARRQPTPTRADARPFRASEAAFSARPTPIAKPLRRRRTIASDAPAARTRSATAAPASTALVRIVFTFARLRPPRDGNAPMRRLLTPAFVVATVGCHSGMIHPDGGSGGAGRGDAAVGDA